MDNELPPPSFRWPENAPIEGTTSDDSPLHRFLSRGGEVAAGECEIDVDSFCEFQAQPDGYGLPLVRKPILAKVNGKQHRPTTVPTWERPGSPCGNGVSGATLAGRLGEG